jgi:hypothetical protein
LTWQSKGVYAHRVVENRRMPNSATHRVRSPTDPCLCASCKRPMAHEVKHCIQDSADGFFMLCDACYLKDDRRNDWEHRGDIVPKRWALLGGQR